jgi:SNF family Na+-dependent transporter
VQQLLEFYILFALSTAIFALFELFLPVVLNVSKLDPNAMVARNKFTTVLTLLVMAVILAPVIFPACIFPAMSARFREALEVGLTSEE